MLKDWRVGKKDLSENVHADWTCRACSQFNVADEKECKKCKAPCPPKTAAIAPKGAAEVDSRVGSSGGHFDRPDPKETRNEHNSDEEEFDDFGRRKRKNKSDGNAGSAAAARKGAAAAMSEKQRAAMERMKAKRGGGGARSRSR